MSRERNYRSEVARLQGTGNNSAAKAWLDECQLRTCESSDGFPGNKQSEQNVEVSLHFFDAADVKEWRKNIGKCFQGVVRTSPAYKSEPGAVLAWLRHGEVRA